MNRITLARDAATITTANSRWLTYHIVSAQPEFVTTTINKAVVAGTAGTALAVPIIRPTCMTKVNEVTCSCPELF